MNKETRIRQRASADATRLSGDDVVKVLELLKGSDSVELKVIVPEGHRGAIPALGFDPVEAEPRQTFFFDTPELSLNKVGLIVRARRSPKGRGDTVVKLRPINPGAIEADLHRDKAFKIEVDVNPGGFTCSGSAKGDCTAQEVLDATEGKVPLKSIFSRAAGLFQGPCANRGYLEGAGAVRPNVCSSSERAAEEFRSTRCRRALALSGRGSHS